MKVLYKKNNYNSNKLIQIVLSHFRVKFPNDHNSSKILSTGHKLRPSVDKTEARSLFTCIIIIFLNNVLNIFLVCWKKRKYTCTYSLNYFTDLFLLHVLYNRLFLIHVMDNALAMLVKSCQ